MSATEGLGREGLHHQRGAWSSNDCGCWLSFLLETKQNVVTTRKQVQAGREHVYDGGDASLSRRQEHDQTYCR
jgi:hypothetical protein